MLLQHQLLTGCRWWRSRRTRPNFLQERGSRCLTVGSVRFREALAATPAAGFPLHSQTSGLTTDINRVMPALIHQESRGNGMAVSPAGALGSTQMLPATAQEMAAKLGLPYRPEMLRSNDPQAIQYQQSLGRAYLMEGLQKTGNIRDALRYYHGGPNRSLWGPKTNSYADAVLGRVGS
jgi:hypothetical protein